MGFFLRVGLPERERGRKERDVYKVRCRILFDCERYILYTCTTIQRLSEILGFWLQFQISNGVLQCPSMHVDMNEVGHVTCIGPAWKLSLGWT
jgi:hypothetical protein